MDNKIDFAGLFKQGRTAEEIMQTVLADAEVQTPKQKTADELFRAMVEQDTSPDESPLADLTLAYNKGEVSDEQYSALYQAYADLTQQA